MAMAVLGRLLERVRGARFLEWALLAIAVAAGILLLPHADSDQSSASTPLEARMESVLSCVKGAGKVRVLVNSQEDAPAFSSASAPVSGVIVVAEGAGNVRVELELLEAVHALLGVDSERIEILAMKEVDP